MDNLGRSIDNTHLGFTQVLNGNSSDGDLFVENDLIVGGDVALDSVIVNDLEVVNELKVDGYTLPTSAGTDGQVIAMNPDGKTTDFKDLTTGTANLFINRLYATEPNVNFPQGGPSQPIYLQRVGSATFSPDEVQPNFGFIKIKSKGFFRVDAPISTGNLICIGEWGVNFNGVQYDFGGSFVYQKTNTGSLVNQGWWECEIVVKSAATAGNLEITYIQANSSARDTGGGNYDLDFPTIRAGRRDVVGTITTPIPASNFSIFGTFKNISNSVDTRCDAIMTEYSMDLMSSSSNVVATSETLTTDHTLLSNLTLGDAGHTQFALLQGRNGGQILSGGTTNLHDLKLKSHTAGLDNIVVKDLNTEFKKNIDMDSNNIINANQITKTTPSGGNLEVKNNDGALVLSAQGGLSNIQLITPNNVIANCNLFESLALVNLFNANIVMNGNNITNIGDLVDATGNNKIDMNDAGFLNAINITSNGNGVNMQETSTGNRISINNTGLASQVVSGGTIMQNTDAGNDIILSKTNGGNIILQNTGLGGNVELEAEGIDINYTTSNFKVRNGLNTSFIIDGTDTETLLNFKCPSINSLTPVGGLSAGTSNSATLSGSTAEQSILALTFVGSRQAPANSFQQGDAYVATLAGNFSSNNADSLTLRLKGGATGTTILSSIVIPLNGSSGVFFELEINFVCRQIGAAGVADLAVNYDFSYNQSAGGNFQGERKCEFNNTTFDTTILNQLDITAQFSSNNAGNSIETILSTLGKTY